MTYLGMYVYIYIYILHSLHDLHKIVYFTYLLIVLHNFYVKYRAVKVNPW
jgi:hypothetical protein